MSDPSKPRLEEPDPKSAVRIENELTRSRLREKENQGRIFKRVIMKQQEGDSALNLFRFPCLASDLSSAVLQFGTASSFLRCSSDNPFTLSLAPIYRW